MPHDIAIDDAGLATPVESARVALTQFLPERVRRQLDAADLAEIEQAAHSWARARRRRLPVDIRFSLPLPFRGLFISVLAGSERRDRERRRVERRRRPLATVGNVAFTACLVGLIYSGLLIGTLMYSGIVE